MDSDSPFSRVERTLWTVWYYITGAVNRFLRPEPTDTVSNDPNSFQESTVDSEPPDAGHPESDTSREVVNEEQAVATASLLSSSKPVVAWELCTTEINLGPGEESMQYKSSESKASEEGEGTREEQISQTGNDDAGLLITNDARAKEDEKEENRDRKLFTHKQDETAEIDEYEDHAKTESLHLTDDAMSEDMDGGGGRADAQEEAQVAVRLDDLQKIEENVGKIQVMEEDDEMHHEDEEDLEVEDTEITLSPMTDFSFEEERNVHIEEACVQRDETDTSVTYEEVENSEDVLELGEKQVKNQFSVCEEPLENVEDVKQDTGLLLLNDDLQMTFEKSGHVSEDVEQEHLKVHRSESDKIEDEREEEEESTLDEREQGAEENVNVSADSQSTDEEPEQEEDIKTVPEDSQEDILTERVSCHEEVMQNAEAESTQHTAEFTDEEKEDVAKDAKVQTKIRETDNVGMVTDEKSHVTTTDISVDERFFDKDQVEEERLSSEEKDSDDYMEIACTTTSVTGVPEGETGQEISGEFENITPGICEGPVVVSQELNSPTCKETQEGVPEYNNEPGPDENITQRFLEVGEGDCKEIHDAQLPEEVESEEPESLQNTGGDYLLVSEHMEEERQSTEDITDEHTEILNLTDTGLPQETEKTVVEPVTEGSGRLFEEEEGKSLDSSMKMGIEHSEKEFETYIGVTDKTNEATKELRDETGELLVEFEIDEGLSDFRDAARDGHEIGAIAAEDLLVKFTDKTIKTFEAEEQKMTEMTFQESVDAKNSEQKTSSLLEDITESGFMKQLVETEPKLLEDSTVEMEDAGIDMEETGYGVEDEAIEGEMQNENEMEILNLEPAGMATDPTTENNNNTLLEESELSRPDESVETRLQLLDEAFKIRNEEMLADTEVSDELMTTESEIKDMTLILTEAMEKHGTESERNYAEEASSSVTGCQDVIDEEILDLWIETALSKDTNDMERQEGSQPEQKMDTKIEPSTDEQDEMPSVHAGTEKEQLAESNSGESGLVSVTEMSSSTAESGFLDQSVRQAETGTGSENQLLKSLSTGSFQGTYDIFASISESLDISEWSTQKPISDTQDILIEEAVEIEQSDLTEEESIIETGFHPDSGVVSSEAGHLSQESDLLQEKTDEERVESAESETGSQKELDADITDVAGITDWKDTEEANEVTAPDCPSEIKHESRSGTETSLQEEIMSAGSEDDTCAEPENLLKLPSLDKPQPGWVEDIAESLLELDGGEVGEQLTTTSEDQIESDRSSLDFTAQRSRIAVKNPRVRPPKDPRSLLHMPSVEPTPSSHMPVRVPAGVPLGGMGIGIKLPGLGAGFPVLKKTRPVVKGETSSETPSQEPETKPEKKSDTPKEDEVQHKPKWMPPRQPGFGNPLMSELKSKLKKPTQE